MEKINHIGWIGLRLNDACQKLTRAAYTSRWIQHLTALLLLNSLQTDQLKKLIDLPRLCRKPGLSAGCSTLNIISLYEVGDYKNTSYLVFESVEGITLREVIKRKKPISVPDALKIMGQILDGISQAHQQGIIHNDLKPENIMISRQGVPRVMDFGISMMVEENSQANTPQRGTLLFMAPECFSGGAISKSADVFSLGLILYELLTFTPCVED